MKRRSLSLLTYAVSLGSTYSEAARSWMRRSARRHTVRAMWAFAEMGDPPGRTNALTGGVSASRVSIHCSSPAMSLSESPHAGGCSPGFTSHARYPPMLKSMFCMPQSFCRMSGGHAGSERSAPRNDENSSMVPYASRRVLFLAMRVPPTRDVVPASPVRVYRLLFAMVCNARMRARSKL